MLHLHLVRHGHKASDPDVLTSRSAGIQLSPLGRRQAELLAARLSQLPIARLLSSPLERAVETAQPLARLTGLKIETDDAFHEMEFGAWTNRRASALELDPLWREFNTHRSSVRTPDGESMADVQRRFISGLHAIRDRIPEGNVVIVSHEDPIKSALLHFLNTSLDEWWRLTIAPASISTVALDGNRATVLRISHELGFLHE